MNSFDVITVGNALLDVFLTIQEDNIHSRLHKEEQELCFKYGEKIHVDACEFHLGGNACNVAVGLSRLPLRTALCAEIGDDVFSQKIVNILSREAIDRSLVVQSKEAPSSFAIGVNYAGERTLFVEHVKRNHEFNLKDVSCKWIYLTSLGVEWKGPYRHVLDYVKETLRPIRPAQGKQAQGKEGVKIAFSPGTHQLEAFDNNDDAEGKELILDVLKIAEILFANKQEAERIVNSARIPINGAEVGTQNVFGSQLKSVTKDSGASANTKNFDASPRQSYATRLQKFGPRIVSITDGKNGSYSVDESGKIRTIGTFPSQTIEKTGAGDAYATGFLGAIISGLSIEEAMRWGAVNAASVVEKVGAQPGLLTKSEIEERLTSHPEFQVQEV